MKSDGLGDQVMVLEDLGELLALEADGPFDALLNAAFWGGAGTAIFSERFRRPALGVMLGAIVIKVLT